MKRFFAVLFIALMLVPVAHARRSGELIPVRDAVVVEKTSAQAAKKTHDAIIKGAKEHGWQVTSDTPNLLRLNLNVRDKHFVVVDVKIKGGSVDVDYVSSVNMKYSKGSDGVETIHPNYNRWIAIMLKSARASLGEN